MGKTFRREKSESKREGEMRKKFRHNLNDITPSYRVMIVRKVRN